MDVDLKKVDQGKIKAFFSFELLILPMLVKIGFVLGIIGIVLSGITLPFRLAMFMGRFDFGAFVIGCVTSAIMIPLLLVGLRLVCESMIVLFKIHDALVPKKPEPAGPEIAAAKPAESPKPDAPPAA